MSSLTRGIVISTPMGYRLAVAALLGAAMLAGPLTMARADNAPVSTQLTEAAPLAVAVAATDIRGDTFNQRITKLCQRTASADEYCQPRELAGSVR